MADLLSSDHLETFYKSHVQSRKNKPHEDIQAIEKEIEKIKQYKAKFLTWCWWNNGSSEPSYPSSGILDNFPTKCCDSERLKPTASSQFKLFNSSEPNSASSSPLITTHTFNYTSPTSTQVSYHWIVHDHDYCSHGN